MAIFGYSGGHFFMVKASSDQVNIFPGTFSSEADGAYPAWQEIGNAFYQDLSPQSGLDEFSLANSAAISFGAPLAATGTDILAATSSEPAPVTGDGEPVAVPSPETPAPAQGETTPSAPDAPVGEVSEIPAEAPAEIPAAEPVVDEPPAESAPETPASDGIVPGQTQTPESAPQESSAETPAVPAAPEPAPAEAPAPEPLSLRKIIELSRRGIARLVSSLLDSPQARAGEPVAALKQSVIFSDFSVPAAQQTGLLDNIQLRLSLAGASAKTGDRLRFDYTIDGVWEEVGVLSLDAEISNAVNGGYFLFGLPLFDSWQAIDSLKIRASLERDDPDAGEEELKAYIDAVWLEINTRPEGEGLVKGDAEENPDAVSPKNFDFRLLSEKRDFRVDESPSFKFSFQKKRSALGRLGAGLMSIFYDEYKDMKIEASFKDGSGTERPMVRYLSDGEFAVELPKMTREFRPGRHTVEMKIADSELTSGQPLVYYQDFSWGVIAFNADKSLYLPAETAYLQMGVVDDGGHTICNARLSLEITAPDGGVAYLDQDNGLVVDNPDCGPDNVIKSPDYFAYYGLAGAGLYQVKLVAETYNGRHELSDRLEVREGLPFEIQRTGPSRIFPKADYEMKLTVKANEDHAGEVTDYAPLSFRVYGGRAAVMRAGEEDFFPVAATLRTGDSNNSEQLLIWQGLELKKDDTLELVYTFDAPDVSPEFFLLGPAAIGNFREARNWQIASDAVDNRVRTVEYFAGSYSSNGTTGQNSDTDQTFSTFDFRLAETGVTIQNAYIVFESQYEAWNNNGSYSGGYTLAFDACAAPCTADAFNGTSTVSKSDTTVLSYDETSAPASSNMIRLLADVTQEAQLAAYTGASTLNAQVGYNLKRGAAANSIGNAKAKLVVTYVYENTSLDVTNTVYYPLESTAAGDSGSRRASVNTGCSFGSTCPAFSYNMDIPEFASSSGATGTSKWFEVYNHNDLNTTNDISATMQIGSSGATAAALQETGLSDQGSLQAAYFDNVPGFSENTDQTIEYRPIATNGVFYGIGGEVAETYVASSSAPTKTRTVSFPVGVLSNGAVSPATSTISAPVYFPENGLATGTVTVKKAWFRILTNNYLTGSDTLTVATKVGSRASSSAYVYAYDPGSNVAKPTLQFIHVIPAADYAELALANASTSQPVILSVRNSFGNAIGGVSAELMITYAYTSEESGYLSTVRLYAGQSETNPGGIGVGKSTTTPTAAAVLPETAGRKTMLGGSLLASYLMSDSDGSVAAAAATLDADLATGTPACSNFYNARPDGNNTFSEYYTDVSASLTSAHNQTYNACYSNSGAGDTSGGAKMNGQLIYTYAWEASGKPTGDFNSIAQKMDGSGGVDISIEVNDPGQENARAKLEYVSGTDCNFSTPADATVDEATSTITSDFGSVLADNNSAYQVGTSTGWIITTSGSNTVNFDWLSKVDEPLADGTYCVRLTVNNGSNDQESPTTTLVTLDNIAPTAPGQLVGTSTGTTVTLDFGAETSENHFSRYRIYYKQGTSSVSESDSEATDANLLEQDYNGATSTVVRRLEPDTDYVFNIWAYDESGNRASSTEITVRTQAARLRANTVKFLAGIYSSPDGITGQSANATQTLPNFEFKLSEKEVEVRNAYVVFETQFEAYINGSEDYDAYSMSFDSCSGACTPVATSGLVKYDDTVVANDETAGSNIARFLMDVSAEPEIASYAGEGQSMTGQFAYMFHKTTAANSIANAKAYLVLTYVYNADVSENFTNTVAYPLESAAAGDSGTRRSVQSVASGQTSCVLDSTCPVFSYNMAIPEVTGSSQRVRQWFETYGMDDLHAAEDVRVDVNIQGTNINSDIFAQEAVLGGTQGNLAMMPFKDVSGYQENTAQQLEYHPVCADAVNGANYYVLGGETFETYIASTSASVKTRTVSFPLGIVNSNTPTTLSLASKDIYFPENGNGSGNVDIKKAWIRVVASNITRAGGGATYNLTLNTKSGANATSSNYVYVHRPGLTMSNSMFKILHVIPAADYAEIEAANAVTPKTVFMSSQSDTGNLGGISAELVITYSYADESNGHLTTISLFGGQSAVAAGQSTTTPAAPMVLPETTGTNSVRAAGLLASYLLQDSDNNVSSPFLTAANLSTAANPSCASPAYRIRADSRNSFGEMHVDVLSAMSDTDRQQYYACYANNGAGDTSGGAKMNGQLTYTYQHTAPSQVFTQDDWRWYDNDASSVVPSAAKALENTQISNINLGEILRLRMNVVDSVRYLATSSDSFKLQYAWGANCTTTAAWTDVGTSTEAKSWRAYDNPALDDGASASTTVLLSSDVVESYEENNPTSANLRRLNVGESGEWDWTIYNYSATSSLDYCFRMAKSDGTAISYEDDGYPLLTTAPANTAPGMATNLNQYVSTSTSVANGAWISTSTFGLAASAIDVNMSELLTLYFEFVPSSTAFTVSTSEPAGACAYGTAYDSCASKIWYISSSSPGDYRVTPFSASTSITAIPDIAEGYKWQVLSCDDSAVCSAWRKFNNAAPNVKVDTSAPTAPGSLTFNDKTPTTVTVNFGATSTDVNFYRYRIFYKAGGSGVTEADLEHTDANMDYVDYNGAATTTISSLSAGTQYVFNIWAYDNSGNKASGTVELVVTTASSFTPPSVTINSVAQKTDGSGAIDISIMADDPDNDDTLRAKIEYVAYSGSCDFTSPLDPTIDPADESTYSTTHGTFDPAGDPEVDNSEPYQVGTSTGWILTSPGPSDVFFDWLSKSDIPEANGTYCVRITASDGYFDSPSTTQMMIIDNVAPAVPGALTLVSKSNSQARLAFGSASSDTRFSRYRIYYSTTTPVTETGVEHTDANLNFLNYNLATTTTVTGLQTDTDYHFNIWAYDELGNRSSSTELSLKTDAVPDQATSTGQFMDDGVTAVSNSGWTIESAVKLTASANDADTSELLTLYFELLPQAGSFKTATTVPSGACTYGTAYNSCSSKVWFVASSSPGDYSVTPFTDTASITAIPDSASGYKWQVLVCDDDDVCASSWTIFDAVTPNFKVDTVLPTAPGALTESSKTANSINLAFGATSTEANFSEYRIYYATSTPVSESSYLFGSSTDANLGNINYNGASFASIGDLMASTTYYFSIWAYDQAGNQASSSETAVTTNTPQSTPGVMFYTKNTRVLYYKTWNGTSWSNEKTGPTFGSGATDYVRHIRSVRSDDGSKVGLVVKTWDGTNQEFWGSVYRIAADDFVSTSQLGAGAASANYAGLMTADIASLSGGWFMAVRSSITANGTTIYSWDAAGGWVSQGAGPNPGQIVTGAKFTRRPGTDNYLLSLFDASTNINTIYYYGGSTYANSWTTLTLHSSNEQSVNNFVGDAFFDQADNTRGALNYTDATGVTYTNAKYFSVTNNSIAYATATSSPASWTANFIHGEFAADPGTAGTAFYSGRNSTGELNLFKVDVSGGSPVWTVTTNGDNVSGSGLYADTNNAQKPYASAFYKNGKAVLAWNNNVSATPKYRVIDTAANSVGASDTAVEGAAAGVWTRVRFVKDPNEQEFLAHYQNNARDYYAVFWNGASTRFYNSTNNPGSGQIWTAIATASGNFDWDDEASSFAFGKNNSAPATPSTLVQYKSDASTTIANAGWTDESQLVLKASVNDPDTSEVISLYYNFTTATGTFVSSTVQPADACSSGTAFSACASQIWGATSTLGDYSVTAFSGTTSITGIPDSPSSSAGYKWQVMACDDQARCSNWTAFNATVPNLKVDTVAPTAPGALAVYGKNSYSVTLNFGAQTVESNFKEYRIYYKQAASGVTEGDTLQNDPDLSSITYNGTGSTTVVNLASSTQYVFNIWAYDWAGNKASATPEVSTTTNPAPLLRQTSYVFENDDGANANSNSLAGSVDTQLSGVPKGERLNLRIQVENTGGDISANKVYRLQYENQTDSPGTWADVGLASDMSYSSGLSGTNGDIITGAKATSSALIWTFGEWRESTNLSGAFTLMNGYYTEFVYAIHTGNAQLGDTYRFRLYNNTDGRVMESYDKYPTLSVVSPETKRFSKGVYASLPAGSGALTYYLDQEGYADTLSDDGLRDAITAAGNYPVANFTIATTTNSKALTATWNGQSSVSAATSTIYLQAYRFGTTNAWVTVASSTTAAADTDFDLSGTINSHVAQYYDGSNLTYWRVYQDSGGSTLRSDTFNILFTDPTPYVSLLHYQWRYDNGNEAGAGDVEPEDFGYPTNASTTYPQIGSTTRLRFNIANSGGGSAAYSYRLEFAATPSNCLSDPGGWAAVPTTTGSAFIATTSPNFANGDNTTPQMANSEGNTFTAGKMIEYPSNSTGAITLAEDRYTEIEYAISPTADASAGGTYCFRVTNAGTDLDHYSRLAELTVAGILNLAPLFIDGGFPDDGGSDISAPTNYGSDIVFHGTASTTDEGDYYLAICKTNSITAGNDAPPTCNGGAWCISGLASSTLEASCSYTAATSSEELAWYGFACDKHPGTGVAKCSAMSQGDSGSSLDSPFNINHPPVFTSVYTLNNNQNPGATFYIMSTSSDSDVLGGADTLTLHVCRTNSANFSGCTAGASDTVCSAVGTSSPNASCTYDLPIPSAATTTAYYGFLFDSHGLAATTTRSSSYTINNTPASLSSIFLNGGNNITLNVKGAADKQVDVVASTTDLNGCDTLVSATGDVYMSNASGGFNCVANYNNCYKITSINCVKTGCAGGTESGYACTASMKYFATPTDDSNGNPNVLQTWLGYINIYDGANYVASTSGAVEVMTSMALDVTENTIDFSTLFAGENTGASNQPTTVVNYGNSPIDAGIYGTNMTGPGGAINVGNIKWNLDGFDWSLSGTPLSGTEVGVDLNGPKPTSTAEVSDTIWWGVGIPFGSAVSTYSGVNTFIAQIDQNGW